MIPNFRLMLSKASSIKKGYYACLSLDNVEMYTKVYKILSIYSMRFKSYLSVFANCSLIVDGRTHTAIIVQTCGSCSHNHSLSITQSFPCIMQRFLKAVKMQILDDFFLLVFAKNILWVHVRTASRTGHPSQ